LVLLPISQLTTNLRLSGTGYEKGKMAKSNLAGPFDPRFLRNSFRAPVANQYRQMRKKWSMAINSEKRTSIILSLVGKQSESLMDVGCGPITAAYPYADKAEQVTCVDWNLTVNGPIAKNISCLNGNFTEMDFPRNHFDTIIAADVFEHVSLEQESLFVEKCVSALRPSGEMIISVPHQGTFAWLDPYQVKPTIHRLLWRMGIYKKVHNGYCDIRKGHKHYTADELVQKFKPLELMEVVYSGYFFDPLLSWAVALSRRRANLPGFRLIEQACRREYKQDFGRRSFNVAIKFRKPSIAQL
jgi:2-polyprenyl-3-methyl-5-hydroxy-6-metoxy-1,4-benzoquinol methylase